MTIFSAAILLFFVMDPIGNIPLFLAALGPVEPGRRARVVGRELFIAYGLLVGFLLAGRPLLAALHISEPALTMAGGIVLFLIAIRMTFPAAHGPLVERVEGEPFVVPLAIPYVAGPSALATVLLLTSREPERTGEWFAAVTLAWLASAAILLLSHGLARVLGDKGITAIERLMGMVLVASAVQMFLDGLKKAFAVLAVGIALAGAGAARCEEPDGAAVAEAPAARLDVDRFLPFTAVELLLGRWDGYTQAANNYRLSFDPADGRARFLVHGMDQILGDPGAPILDIPGAIVARAVMDGRAGVRASGAGRENAVAGTVERRRLFHGFTVEEDEREVELVAELRAAAGEAAFDGKALTLHRLGP